MKLKKSLGQYFLVDKKALAKIVEAASLDNQDVVLEIGSGSGILTKELARRAKKVIAVEIDEKFAKVLKTNLRKFSNTEVIFGDIRKIFSKLNLPKNYKVVANIPYYITSPILKMFLSFYKKPQEMVLLVQREVAERICVSPGDASILSVSVRFYGEPEILSTVNRNSFRPVPKVDSAILKISNITDINTKLANEKEFFKTVRIGFSSRRKTLANNLSAGFHIPKDRAFAIIKSAGLDIKIRAQKLNLCDWIKISNIID